MRNRKRGALALLLVTMILGTGCTQERVNDSEIGVHYTDGPLEGKHFEKILEPGDSQFVVNDSVYRLPARPITWITGPGAEADAATLQFTAQTGELMNLELRTQMVLNTTLDKDGEGPFKTFFNGLCRKFDCWEGALDGTPGKDDGWNRMLLDVVGNPQMAAAIAVGREYVGEELRYNTDVQNDFEDKFAAEFESLLADEVNAANTFCGPTYKRGEKECPVVSVNVTKITFNDPNREALRERAETARRAQETAVAEEAAAVAQQRVNAAKATPEYRSLAEAEALKACGAAPGSCTFIITGGDEVPISVPVG